MDTEPLLSVVMPAYNAEKYIAESIESVLKQTFTDLELLIVDDGSTDRTRAIIDEFAIVDKRIKLLCQDRGRQGKARNLAIKNSRGKYIAFLDADDTWLPNKLQVQVDILKHRAEIDLVFCPGYIVAEHHEPEYFYVTVKEWCREEDMEVFTNVNQIPILSAVVKKQALLDAGSFTEDPSIQNCEDYHLWLKLLGNGCRFLSIPGYLFNYRVHEHQSTHKGRSTQEPLLNCYIYLVKNNIISIESKALRKRLKWMIFQPLNLAILFEQMKIIFPGKRKLLSFFISVNKLSPDKRFLKNIAFHTL
jgi:teichuronic acid biosynthesis glycosyltransferase TuaG